MCPQFDHIDKTDFMQWFASSKVFISRYCLSMHTINYHLAWASYLTVCVRYAMCDVRTVHCAAWCQSSLLGNNTWAHSFNLRVLVWLTYFIFILMPSFLLFVVVVIFHLGAHLLTLPLSLMCDYTTIWPIHFVYVIINTVFAQVIRPKISDTAHSISNVKWTHLNPFSNKTTSYRLKKETERERKRANNIVSAWLLVMMHVAGSALMTDATILPDNRI